MQYLLSSPCSTGRCAVRASQNAGGISFGCLPKSDVLFRVLVPKPTIHYKQVSTKRRPGALPLTSPISYEAPVFDLKLVRHIGIYLSTLSNIAFTCCMVFSQPKRPCVYCFFLCVCDSRSLGCNSYLYTLYVRTSLHWHADFTFPSWGVRCTSVVMTCTLVVVRVQHRGQRRQSV